MFRIIAVALLGAYLMAVGIWPAAAAPVAALLSGVAVLLGLIPKAAWLLAGFAAIVRNDQQPAPAPVVTD